MFCVHGSGAGKFNIWRRAYGLYKLPAIGMPASALYIASSFVV
jgi:hypothetical protein